MSDLLPELNGLALSRDAVVTIGVLDGVHVGHQHLLRHLKSRAAALRCASLVLTFINHPQTVLRPEVRIPYLTTLDERLRLLREQSVDYVTPVRFTTALSQLAPRDFVSILRERLRMKGLVIGPDFALGKGRQGNETVLRELGKELGFQVFAAGPYLMEGEVVSSTAIRQALAAGLMDKVTRFLGRTFHLTGDVVHGTHRGRTLGYPTANISYAPDQALPADGVYATFAHIGGKRWKAATNVGLRPTFHETARTVEAFIIDFQGDIYGQAVTLEFVKRLRGEERFDSLDALKEQIARDVAQAKAVLS